MRGDIHELSLQKFIDKTIVTVLFNSQLNLFNSYGNKHSFVNVEASDAI